MSAPTSQCLFLTHMKNDGFRKTLDRIAAQKRAAHRLDRTVVRAGWIDGAKTMGGPDFSIIARTLCYGRESGTTRNGSRYSAITARNFVRAYGLGFAKKAEKEAGRALQLVFTRGAEYQADLTKALSGIGAQAAGGLRMAIVNDRYKPNARSTVLAWARRHTNSTKAMRRASKLKGDDRFFAMAGMKKELVDTGALVQHITYDVVKK